MHSHDSSHNSQTIVRRFFEDYNQGDLEAVGKLFSPDYVCHIGGSAELVVGLDASMQAEAYFRGAFSGIHWTIDDLFGEGEKVVVRRTWRMTHTGPFQGLPPSGRILAGTAIDIFTVQDGRIVEQWTESDNLSFMQQLGALPMEVREPGL